MITRAEAFQRLEQNVVDPGTHRREIERVFEIAGINDSSVIGKYLRDVNRRSFRSIILKDPLEFSSSGTGSTL